MTKPRARDAVWWRGSYCGVATFAERFGWRGATVDVETLLHRAREEAGHDDFGDEDFMEPLSLLVREFEKNAQPDVLGRQVFARVLVQCLKNRARIRAAIALHPGIAKIPITAPVFIVGFPRTGTTLLQGLLSRVGLRTPLRWETDLGQSPGLSPRKAIDRHIRWVKGQTSFVDAISPDMAAAHELGALLPEECNPLLMNSLRALFFALLFDTPDYEDYVYATQFRDSYAWHKRHLQLLSYGEPATTWVLKAPAHMASLEPLLATYPDARVVFTHRDPAESVPSMASLAVSLRMLVSSNIDRHAIGRALMTSLARMQDASDAARSRWPASAPPFLDVSYDELVREPHETVRGIVRHFGIPEPTNLADVVRGHLKENRQHRRGEHRYDPADFGLDAKEMHRVFHNEAHWLAQSRGVAQRRSAKSHA